MIRRIILTPDIFTDSCGSHVFYWIGESHFKTERKKCFSLQRNHYDKLPHRSVRWVPPESWLRSSSSVVEITPAVVIDEQRR